MSGLEKGCKEPYNQQIGCIIKLALRDVTSRGREQKLVKPSLDLKSFLNFNIVVFSFVFGSYCLIID